MPLHVADHREAAGGGDRVGGERVAGLVLHPVGRIPPEGGAHLLREEDGRDGRVAARETLADTEEVRPDAGLLSGEPGAEPAEPGHDLVEDQEHPRLVAERAQPPQVVGGELVHPGGQHHRLDDDRGDGARPLLGDHVPQLREAAEGARTGAGPTRAGDRRMDVDAAAQEWLVRRAQLRPPGRGERAHRRAVVGAIERDRLVPLGAPALTVVLARHLDRCLRRLGSAGELLHDVVAAARDADQLGRELERTVGGRHDRRREREPPVLRDDGVDDLLVAVAEADREHAREPVDVALSLVIRQPDAVAADHDQRVRAEGLHLVEVDHHVTGGRAEVAGLDVCARRLRHLLQSVLVRPSRQVVPRIRVSSSACGLDLSDRRPLPSADAGRRPPGVGVRAG